MVEFAFVLPLLILLIFGIIEFGLVLYNKAVITNASREGARKGIVAQDSRVTDAEITTVVNNYCASYLVTFGAPNSPVTQVARTGTASGSDLTVTVNYTYGFLVIPSSITGPITFNAVTKMKLE